MSLLFLFYFWYFCWVQGPRPIGPLLLFAHHQTKTGPVGLHSLRPSKLTLAQRPASFFRARPALGKPTPMAFLLREVCMLFLLPREAFNSTDPLNACSYLQKSRTCCLPHQLQHKPSMPPTCTSPPISQLTPTACPLPPNSNYTNSIRPTDLHHRTLPPHYSPIFPKTVRPCSSLDLRPRPHAPGAPLPS